MNIYLTLSYYHIICSIGIDVSALKALPVEGDTTGAASRLQQIESVNGPQPDDEKDIAFEKLPSGASYRQYREGKGDAEVKEGSKVAIECTIRCQSFATANEPGGLKYFSTKTDTEFNELVSMHITHMSVCFCINFA